MEMKTLAASLLGLFAAVPAHALSIVTLHGGMNVPMLGAGADIAALVLGIAALSVVVAFRACRRKDRA